MRQRLLGHLASLVVKIGGTAIALCVSLAACTGVPRPELEAYAGALAQAQEAGLAVYREIIPALATSGTETSDLPGFPFSLGPTTYDRTDCDADFAAYEALLARCAAFAAVRSFNEALLMVEQGARVEAVRGRLEVLKDSASTLVALIPVPAATAAFATASTLFPALETLAGELLKVQERATLKARLDEGAPIVGQLLNALRADVPRLYDLQYRHHRLVLREHQGAVTDALAEGFPTAAGHSAAVDPAAAELRRALDARFERLFDRPEPRPGPRRLRDLVARVAGAPPFDAAAAATISRSLDLAEVEVARFHAAAAEWQRWRTALFAYDDLLAAVRAMLDTLLRSSNNPLAPGGGTTQLLTSLLEIRRQAIEIQRLLDLREPAGPR